MWEPSSFFRCLHDIKYSAAAAAAIIKQNDIRKRKKVD